VKSGGVLGVERFAHVETVEPHLRRIDLLVPEAAFGSARVRLQLFAQLRAAALRYFSCRVFVKNEQVAPGSMLSML
jgi:hypothetical protein